MPGKAPPLTYVKLVAAMAMWGGTWIAGRIVAQELRAPLAVAAIRFLLAGLALAAVALISERRLDVPRSWAAWRVIAGLGFFGIFLYGLCFFYGLKHIPAGRGALVVALNPVAVVLTAWLLGQEGMSSRKALGCVIALAGSLTVIGNGDPLALLHGSVGLGELLIVGCVICWTAYTFIGRQATRLLSPLTTTLFASLAGALLIGLAAIYEGDFQPQTWSWRVWASLIFLALFGTAIAYTWYTDAVHRIGAGQAALFINLVPVFAVLQAAWLLDERLGLPVLFGGLLVIAGVSLATQHGKFARIKNATPTRRQA